jgi:hypothetical protein
MADRVLSIVGRVLLYWLAMLVAMFCLGTLRELFLRPVIGELPAHQIGSAAAIVVIALFARRFISRTMVSPGRAVFVGAFWVALTATFEFGFFHFIVGHPWEVLTADYNLAEGRLMGVLMLVTFVAPWAYAVLFRNRWVSHAS